MLFPRGRTGPETPFYGVGKIPESELLSIAFIGGIVGSIAAQHLLRHKTRKQPFKFYLYGIAGLQIVLLLTLSIPEGRHLVALFTGSFIE